MTVAELIEKLKDLNPAMGVRIKIDYTSADAELVDVYGCTEVVISDGVDSSF